MKVCIVNLKNYVLKFFMSIKPFKIVILSLVAVILVILGWAPWLTKNEVKEIVKTYPNFRYQHNAQRETENPEINVFSTPFCRWVTTYEGGWFVCFWQGFGNSLKNDDKLLESIRDSDCKIYYDSCNTCEKMGMDEVCTAKKCSELGTPACLDKAEGEVKN